MSMEVSPAAEELTEHVKGVSTSSPSLSTLFMLFDSLSAVDIVDFAKFSIGEDFVGFADLGELVLCGFISRVFVGVVFLRKAAVGFFEVALGGGFVEVEELGGLLGL